MSDRPAVRVASRQNEPERVELKIEELTIDVSRVQALALDRALRDWLTEPHVSGQLREQA